MIEESHDTAERLDENIQNVLTLDEKWCHDNDKAELILVLLGLKPATQVVLEFKEEEKQIIAKVLMDLKTCGLAIITGDTHHIPDQERKKAAAWGGTLDANYRVAVFLSTNMEMSQRLKEIIERQVATNEYNPEDEREKGRLYGFPESAVQAFETKNVMPMNEMPTDVLLSDDGLFAGFVLSKENWRKELKTGKKWREALQLHAPELCARLLKERRASTIAWLKEIGRM